LKSCFEYEKAFVGEAFPARSGDKKKNKQTNKQKEKKKETTKNE